MTPAPARFRPVAAATAGHGLLSPNSSLPLDRRGRLRNGARPGDFLAAPRCGARTRCGSACRQPAMKNGRCRMHGGLSTGPRTAEGRARCAAARTIHGGYNAETRGLLADARAALGRFRALLSSGRPTAGHGVLSSKKVNRKDAKAQREVKALVELPKPRSSASLRLRGESSIQRPAPTAGHGVLSSRPSLAQRALLGSTALGISIRPAAVTAGHGVLSPKWPAAARIA